MPSLNAVNVGSLFALPITKMMNNTTCTMEFFESTTESAMLFNAISESSDFVTTKSNNDTLIKEVDYSTTNTVDNNNTKALLIAQFEPITKEFFQELDYDRFDNRFTSRTEIVINSALNRDKALAIEWLHYMFLTYVDQASVLVALLHTLSHLRYDEVPFSVTNLPMNAYVNSDPYVREYVIRCYEKWQNKETLMVLREYYKTSSEKWLKEYIQDVITDLEAGA